MTKTAKSETIQEPKWPFALFIPKHFMMEGIENRWEAEI